MIFQEDIRLPARSNIRRFLPKRETAVLLLVMREVDRYRTAPPAAREGRTAENPQGVA